MTAEFSKNRLFLVCFSVVSSASFENVKEKWVPEIIHHCPRLLPCPLGPRLISLCHRETGQEQAETITPETAEKLAGDPQAVKHLDCCALTPPGLRTAGVQTTLAVLEPPEPKKSWMDRTSENALSA
ncbi:Cell division control protein 42-like protein [Sciurus carolinensis]|uniref:Cell division control protein 42-like protein n=1 Tax=Sciurus carolinensis TaxID=30640 RepID=A0AA41TBF1_SCICA|nr:Cell division control protein 42-like protein [Sciurus carolinensis]